LKRNGDLIGVAAILLISLAGLGVYWAQSSRPRGVTPLPTSEPIEPSQEQAPPTETAQNEEAAHDAQKADPPAHDKARTDKESAAKTRPAADSKRKAEKGFLQKQLDCIKHGICEKPVSPPLPP